MSAVGAGDGASTGQDVGGGSSSSRVGVAQRRLSKDLQSLQRSQNPQIEVRPSEDRLLEWHFVLHSLPADTPYKDGCYHGTILFPENYPLAPPAILMSTPSGRLETDSEKGYGAVVEPEEKRRRLAAESWATNSRNAEFRQLFPEYLQLQSQEDGTETTSTVKSPDDSGNSFHSAHEATEAANEDAHGRLEIGDAEETPSTASRAPSLTGSMLPLIGDVANQSNSNSVERNASAPASDASREADGDEASTECWICRDTTPDEPLIHPCACRGSMSGVHASCVEQWIRHHRRNAVNDEAPRCSVCHQPYQGSELRPGVSDFMRYVCYEAAQQVMRTIVLVIVIVAYESAASPPEDAEMPLAVRVVLIAIFALVTSYKTFVLTVSLPPHRPPPNQQCLRRFFVGDPKLLAMHIAEAFATISILGLWCLWGQMSVVYFLPVLGIGLIPIVKMLVGRSPSLACLKRAAFMVLVFVLSPLIMLWGLCILMYRYPRRVAHPLDAGPHIIVAIAVMPMCLILQSNLAIIILWTIHSAFVAFGLVEVLFVKRWSWQQGTLWWFALQLTFLSAYVANAICTFSKGIGAPDDTDFVVFAVSMIWLLLVLGLTVATNWSLCVQYYRTWQHRNGQFTLQSQAGSAGQVAPEGVV